MSNPELLFTKDEKEDLSNFVKRPTLKFQSQSIETLSSSSNSQYSQKEGKSNHHEVEEYQQICRIRVPKQGDASSSTTPISSEEKLKEDEDEDGFKTPTSLDHKISVPSKCPPAPRKTKPSLKRKASYYNNNCRHPLDLSKEVFELLFPTQHHINPLSASQQTTKKVRRQEHKS